MTFIAFWDMLSYIVKTELVWRFQSHRLTIKLSSYFDEKLHDAFRLKLILSMAIVKSFLKAKYIHQLLNMEYEVISCDTSSHRSCTIKLYDNPTSDGTMFWPNILSTARWIFINYLLSDFVAISPIWFWYRYINYAKGKE